MRMKITILGSGTSTGVPMVGCSCPVCASSDPKDCRTRTSVLIETGGRYILIDTSPDLRRQALCRQIPRIDAVIFTHAHADHVNGIDDLRGFYLLHKRAVPCYATPDTIETLKSNFTYIFDGAQNGAYAPLLEPVEVKGPFRLFGLDVVPVPLTHGFSCSTGYRFGGFAYLTDCSAIPPSSVPLLGNLDILVIDGLRYKPHPSHFNIEGALEAAASLKPRRTILTHLTHQVAHSDAKRLPPGVEFAFDGMVLRV
jgi:phosphoribosyl 1,2-cyclic phosphate phosphodiesterase